MGSKIADRDYFIAEGGRAVRDAIEQAAAELAAFDDAALRADAAEPPAKIRATLRSGENS